LPRVERLPLTVRALLGSRPERQLASGILIVQIDGKGCSINRELNGIVGLG
jgi:hypothetical protein